MYLLKNTELLDVYICYLYKYNVVDHIESRSLSYYNYPYYWYSLLDQA